MMRIPLATYRIQFNSSCRFVDARDLVPYLHELGISDLYSSPWFKPRRGSSHGYDITDPFRVNSELGTEQEFGEMAEKLRHYSMGLLLDIVPNHMAASPENPWWMDVLENGPSSEFAVYFDIDWHSTTAKAAFLQDGKVLVPVLGDVYGNVLENQELTLKIDDTGIYVRYYEHRLPLDPRTYGAVLERALEYDPDLDVLRVLLDQIDRLPPRDIADIDLIFTRRSLKRAIKQDLWNAYHSQLKVKKAIDEALRKLNGVRGEPRSFDALHALLSAQAYRLAFWKIAYEEINYRRFFDINELVGLRVEVPEVFALRHERVFDLVRAGKVTGLRIDHVDGLYDPRGYLERLQSALGEPMYVVVEKILGHHETLRPDWPACGTTGYDFVNALNGIFIQPGGLEALRASYARRTGQTEAFAEIVYASCKRVMEKLFTGEIHAMGHELGELAALDRKGRDVRLSELMQVLVEVTACLPVYRTYIRGFEIDPADRGHILRTLQLARERTSEDGISSETFAFLRRVLLLQPPYYAEDQKDRWLGFVMRWQQFSGPVMAKGLEDTAYYVYSNLISMNEVGGDPLRIDPPFNLERFHRFNLDRLERWPHSMNATSTHDSKRGEDARARINVLSEIPREFEEHLDCWWEMNAPLRRMVGGREAPAPFEEILIYQTLIGSWPGAEGATAEFAERLRQFVTKALREGKVNSSWVRPNTEYEAAVCDFAAGLLQEDSRFLDSFRKFHKKIAHYGAINGLAQALLKIASPGVPDFYQGSELWNFWMVDPDNRGPVDYRRRVELLESLHMREAAGRERLAEELAGSPEQDEAKLYVVAKALEQRRLQPELFAEGEYLPLEVAGAHARNVCAFARRRRNEWAVVATPLWLTQVAGWKDTALTLPPEAPHLWSNVFTGATGESLRAAELFHGFPVALLAPAEA